MARVGEEDSIEAEELAKAIRYKQKSVGPRAKKDEDDEQSEDDETKVKTAEWSCLKSKSGQAEQKYDQEPKESVEREDGDVDPSDLAE